MNYFFLRLTFCIAFTFFLTFSFAQTPDWQWEQGSNGIGYDRGQSIATDNYGYIYVAGIYNSPSINFGSTTLVNTNQNGSSYDIFIVKYDRNGNVMWAKNAGGNGNDIVKKIIIGGNGIIITGYYYSSSILFDTTTLY
ncbi:MAG: hypothetical protein ACHQK8_06710, partial [Bacteroidia bacterium]